jgi:hypothetical protein
MRRHGSPLLTSCVAVVMLVGRANGLRAAATGPAALTISPIPDQVTYEDMPTGVIPLALSTPGADAHALTFSAFVDDSPLLRSSNIVFAGSGADRTVTVTPNPNQIGRASIRVTVSNGESSASTTFALTVVRVISLPPMPALELPVEGQTGIAAEASPMKELLASASAGGLNVTHDREGYVFPIGGTRVTWTAWEGQPHVGAVKAVKRGHVYVFKNGQAPVGLSMDSHATAGNHSAKVVRDSAGGIHMAWLDAGRPGIGNTIMYRRGVQDPTSGAITWETDPVVVADAASDSHVALAVSANAVHFAWFQGGTARYCRLVHRAESWTFGPVRDTKAQGDKWDHGPDLAVRGDEEIHVLTARGVYAVSISGGLVWSREDVPVPSGASIKDPALALDSAGNGHVAFTATYRGTKYSDWHYNDPNGAYWELRYVRRRADGGWTDAQNILAAFTEWRDFNADKSGDDDRDSRDGDNDAWDSLADWADVAVDEADAIHVVWHGPVNTHVFGNDEAFYTRRATSGNGEWGAWETPSPLYPKDPPRGHYFSYAPSLCTDASTKLALAVVFFETTPGHPGVPGDTGDEIFDSVLRVVRDGALMGAPIELTAMARHGMSTWFPCAGPRLFRHANGRAWLDVLQTTTTPRESNDPFHFIVYQRHEVTDLLRTTTGSNGPP